MIIDIRDLESAILRMAKHAVREVPNGREGLDRAVERAPEAAVVDVEMPVLNGPEIAYVLILRDAGDEKVPIILVSGAFGLPKLAQIVGTAMRMLDRVVQERIPPRPRLVA